jgi:uncharacterized repeat protein (TIGR03806 family)
MASYQSGRQPVTALRFLIGCFTLLVAGPAPLPAAIWLPEGFTETQVARGLTGATAMEVAPDGRIFVCEQTGTLRVVKHDSLLPRPFATLTVDSSWERGLLGVALDPHFGQNQYIYLNYIAPSPYPHHRISRFTADGDVARPGSEVILFEGDNQNQLGGGVKNGHQGGAIHFGADGKLYVAIGDQTAGAPAQDLKTLQGKLLRLNPDGSIPADNPFVHNTGGKYRAIWALGLRNPFCFAVQPGTGRLFINDVGGANEEINEGVAGANYGWPTTDHGPTHDPRFRGPLYWYPESSITGGTFYNPPRSQFPSVYTGKYFFADFKAGWIKTLDPDDPRRVTDFATGFGQWTVVDLKVGLDGSLYYLSRNMWVRDKDFRPNSGTLGKIRYTGAHTPPRFVADLPDQTIIAGGRVAFRAAATGSLPLKYSWQVNGSVVPAGTGPILTLPHTRMADNGSSVRCTVSNLYGQATSNPAMLRVKPAYDDTAARGGLFVTPAPGTYTGPVTVRVARGRAETVLRYTTDGSTPTATSPGYTAPFVLRHTATVKLREFIHDEPAAECVSATFVIQGTRPYGLAYRESVSTLNVPPVPEDVPRLLSQTAIFASLTDLRPNRGLIPYTVNAPLWSDGAVKRRWLALAPGGQIGFAPTGEWTFPAGSVFVKHFEIATDETRPEVRRRLETRLLVVDGTGYGYGVTYKWRLDDRDADLLVDGLSEPLTIKTATGSRTQTWQYPSKADCLTCHTPAARFVRGVKTRQLNGELTYPDTGITDNQLRTWNYLGLFHPALNERRIAGYSRLVAVEDSTTSLVQRARSYLDANCAHCHRPGNTLRATFDARYDTPLAKQGLVDALTVSDSLGLAEPRVVLPGDPHRSMLYHRLTRSDNFRMPPLAVHIEDRAAVAVLDAWITSLARPTAKPQGGGQ